MALKQLLYSHMICLKNTQIRPYGGPLDPYYMLA